MIINENSRSHPDNPLIYPPEWDLSLQTLNLSFPPLPQPVGTYVPAQIAGNLVFVSGQLPFKNGELLYPGKLGDTVTVEMGQKASAQALLLALCALLGLGIKANEIKQVIKLTGYINGTPHFTQQPQVLNGASELCYKLLGERGKHARAAVGVSSLPLGSCVELELIVQVTTQA